MEHENRQCSKFMKGMFVWLVGISHNFIELDYYDALLHHLDVKRGHNYLSWVKKLFQATATSM